MWRRLLFYFSCWVYWLLFFTASRLLFLGFYIREGAGMLWTDWLRIVTHGWIMDLSATAYLLFIPTLVLMVVDLLPPKLIRTFLTGYTILALVINTVLLIIDLVLYGYWGTRLDLTPLFYLKTTPDALASIEWRTTLLPLLCGVGLAMLFYFLWSKLLELLERKSELRLPSALIFLLALVFSFIPIRGGLGLAPLNPGRVFFHQNHYANQAALNVFWNCGYSGLKSHRSVKPYHFYPAATADSCLQKLYAHNQSSSSVVRQKRPNIIIIILESWTAAVIGPLGGNPAVTPNFNRYAEQGILFTNFYAAGDRTDKCLPAILSGYPPLPQHQIIKYPGKLAKLPSLFRDLRGNGYHTAFYYGGDPNFANLKGYLLTAQVDHLVSKSDFPKSTYGAKWGVHDEYMLARFADDLLQAPEPFAYVLLTLSSHEPYDVPDEPRFGTQSRAARLMNTVYYADKHLGRFLDRLQQSALWERTWIILLADHGVRYFDTAPHYQPAKFQIPMLWLGGALRRSGLQVATYGSQTDLPLTILHQIGLDSPAYRFSHDLFSRSPAFACYTFNNGCAFLAPNFLQIWSNSAQRYLVNSPDNSSFHPASAKIYLQSLSEDFYRR